MIHERLLLLKCFCQKNLGELELWPSFYERRYQEFLSYYEHLKKFPLESVLEIGCGLGYSAALLSVVAKEVVATDLEEGSPQDHAIGLGQTRHFLERLGIKNVRVIGASAECMPFPDQSFDLVFSSHVLEHIPDREQALREIQRLLKPGGIHFCVTPTRAERVYYFFLFYAYLCKRSLVHATRLLRQRPSSTTAASMAHPVLRAAQSQLRHFPFPPVHGSASHYLQELRDWSFSRWRKTLGRHGAVIGQYSTQLHPALVFGGLAFPEMAIRLHAQTRHLEFSLGKIAPLKFFGINCVTITRKADSKSP